MQWASQKELNEARAIAEQGLGLMRSIATSADRHEGLCWTRPLDQLNDAKYQSIEYAFHSYAPKLVRVASNAKQSGAVPAICYSRAVETIEALWDGPKQNLTPSLGCASDTGPFSVHQAVVEWAWLSFVEVFSWDSGPFAIAESCFECLTNGEYRELVGRAFMSLADASATAIREAETRAVSEWAAASRDPTVAGLAGGEIECAEIEDARSHALAALGWCESCEEAIEAMRSLPASEVPESMVQPTGRFLNDYPEPASPVLSRFVNDSIAGVFRPSELWELFPRCDEATTAHQLIDSYVRNVQEVCLSYWLHFKTDGRFKLSLSRRGHPVFGELMENERFDPVGLRSRLEAEYDRALEYRQMTSDRRIAQISSTAGLRASLGKTNGEVRVIAGSSIRSGHDRDGAKSDESQAERIWSPEELEAALESTSFEAVSLTPVRWRNVKGLLLACCELGGDRMGRPCNATRADRLAASGMTSSTEGLARQDARRLGLIRMYRNSDPQSGNTTGGLHYIDYERVVALPTNDSPSNSQSDTVETHSASSMPGEIAARSNATGQNNSPGIPASDPSGEVNSDLARLANARSLESWCDRLSLSPDQFAGLSLHEVVELAAAHKYAVQSSRANEPPSAAEARSSRESRGWKQRLRIDRAQSVVELDGIPHLIKSEDSLDLFEAMLKAWPDYVSASDHVTNPPRAARSWPEAIRNIVDREPGKGYRLKLD